MVMFGSLKHRLFALLWLGQALSRLGDSIYRVALAWWVLEKTGSATAMGLVLIISSTPMVFFSLLGGVTADRLPRPWVLLWSDTIRGALLVALSILAFGGMLEIWHVYLLSMAFGFVDAFFQPAYVSLIPELVPRKDLPSANALTSFSGQMANIAGPMLGAAAAAAAGAGAAFALDAASFFLSAVCLVPLLLRVKGGAIRKASHSLLHQVREGMRTVAASPWLWITISVVALGNITFTAPIKVTMPFLVKNHFGEDVNVLGLVYSMLGAGSALGTVLVGYAARIPRRGLLAYGAWMAGGLMILSFGLPVGLEVFCVAALLSGIMVTGFNVIWITTMQETVPRELLGRVASIDNLGSYALLPLGFGIVGWVTDLIGAAKLFVIAGAVSALLGLLALSHRAVRQMK